MSRRKGAADGWVHPCCKLPFAQWKAQPCCCCFLLPAGQSPVKRATDAVKGTVDKVKGMLDKAQHAANQGTHQMYHGRCVQRIFVH